MQRAFCMCSPQYCSAIVNCLNKQHLPQTDIINNNYLQRKKDFSLCKIVYWISKQISHAMKTLNLDAKLCVCISFNVAHWY